MDYAIQPTTCSPPRATVSETLFYVSNDIIFKILLLLLLGLLVASRYVREFRVICRSNKHCSAARCAYAANVVSKDLRVFEIKAVFLSCFIVTVPGYLELLNYCDVYGGARH
jgi:hypothetical protein